MMRWDGRFDGNLRSNLRIPIPKGRNLKVLSRNSIIADTVM